MILPGGLLMRVRAGTAAEDQAEAASTRVVAAVEAEQEMPASPRDTRRHRVGVWPPWGAGQEPASHPCTSAARLQGARWRSCFSAGLSQRSWSFGYLGICSLFGMTSDMERIEYLLFGVPAALDQTETNGRPGHPLSWTKTGDAWAALRIR